MSYTSLNDYLKTEYGRKLYKLSLSSGCSCPNRDVFSVPKVVPEILQASLSLLCPSRLKKQRPELPESSSPIRIHLRQRRKAFLLTLLTSSLSPTPMEILRSFVPFSWKLFLILTLPSFPSAHVPTACKQKSWNCWQN